MAEKISNREVFMNIHEQSMGSDVFFFSFHFLTLQIFFLIENHSYETLYIILEIQECVKLSS